jgi:nicotinate phosphoribosyltransferase
MTPWVDDASAALLTDLYQLTMAQAYYARGRIAEAVFELFVRKLPARRNYLVACGLEDVLHHLEGLRFGSEAIAALSRDGRFTPAFLEQLHGLRFTGNVDAVPEGTPIFAGEPILQVIAPLPEAQLVETFILNQVVYQTVAASKAARVVAAAQGRGVVDFGLRRMQGADAGMKAARAFYVAGVEATSNVLAASVYGIPASGTMAHSYVQVHESELEAFREFAAVYPETVLLIDTYDTLEGVRNVIRLARELGSAFRVRALRLDSGDLLALSVEARRMLDEAGLGRVGLFASGGLDEDVIADLVARGAPIAGFGVGTAMGVSADAPSLDAAYKLVAYAGRGRMKLSSGKATVPGRKQVFRVEDHGEAVRDVVAVFGEVLPGRPLLAPAMRSGQRVRRGPSLEEARALAREERERLPARLRALAPARPPYPVELSAALAAERDRVRREIGG